MSLVQPPNRIFHFYRISIHLHANSYLSLAVTLLNSSDLDQFRSNVLNHGPNTWQHAEVTLTFFKVMASRIIISMNVILKGDEDRHAPVGSVRGEGVGLGESAARPRAPLWALTAWI